ncbi:MAG: hypothetical protein HC836_42660 [Richelia sp. RM2_1_2]|nr:hypothetical protein [Richelia sp. RM2_1_2]
MSLESKVSYLLKTIFFSFICLALQACPENNSTINNSDKVATSTPSTTADSSEQPNQFLERELVTPSPSASYESSEDSIQLSESEQPKYNQRTVEPERCQELGSHRYINMTDRGPGKRKHGYICVVVRDSSDLQSVLTLKHLDSQGDWDIIVGNHFDTVSKNVYGELNYQNNRGNLDELMLLPNNINEDYVVVAFPRSSTPSNACLIFHNFNIAEMAGEQLAKTLLKKGLEQLLSGDNATPESRKQSSRAIDGGISILTRKNLGQVGYDFALNEISIWLADTFGGESWLYDFGIGYFGGYLEQSGKFLFDSNMRCTE